MGRRDSPVALANVGGDVRRRRKASIPPERLLQAAVLMALYTVRSERQFCEQLNYNLLFRWFLDMDMTEPGWEPARSRATASACSSTTWQRKFFYAVVEQAKRERLTSSEHFTVDGTLIEAWASLKSFKNKDGVDKDPPDDSGNPTVDLSRRKAQQRYACLNDRPGGTPRREEQRQGSKAFVFPHALRRIATGY